MERRPDHPEPALGPALGRTVAVLRTDRGLDRARLADLAGISYSYLAAIENGRKVPSAPVLRRLAAALGTRSHDLLAGAEHRIERWQEARPSPGTGTGRRADLDRLLARLDDDDLALLAEMARKLADRSRPG